MKTLSLRPPWGFLILHGKDVENRTWTTPYRGPFLIHSGKSFDYDAMQWLLDNNLQGFLIDVALHFGISEKSNFMVTKGEFGGIIGSVNLDDIIDDSKSVWAMPDCKHWILSGAKELPFKQCKGQQGFWNVEIEGTK